MSEWIDDAELALARNSAVAGTRAARVIARLDQAERDLSALQALLRRYVAAEHESQRPDAGLSGAVGNLPDEHPAEGRDFTSMRNIIEGGCDRD